MWKVLAILGAILSLVDGALTCREIERGLATESNVLMAYLYDLGLPMFWMAKFATVALFWFLGYHVASAPNTSMVAKAGILIGFSAYATIVAWHLFWLF